jgi:hypothetical protein
LPKKRFETCCKKPLEPTCWVRLIVLTSPEIGFYGHVTLTGTWCQLLEFNAWFRSHAGNKLCAAWAPFLAMERYLGPQPLRGLCGDVADCPPLRRSPILPALDREHDQGPAAAFTTSNRRRAADPLLPATPAPPLLRLPRPIPTAQTDDFLVYSLDEHRAAILLRIMHREARAQAWAVLGPAGSWECNDHEKAVAKCEQFNPARRMASR